MTKIEKLNKILSNNGRLFKIYGNPNIDEMYRVTDDLKVEWKNDGDWIECLFSLQCLLDNQIILINNDYTEEQKEICKTLYKIRYRYLARGEDGSLYAFIEYPHRENEGWDTRYKCNQKCLISYNFPQITTEPIALKDIYEGVII